MAIVLVSLWYQVQAQTTLQPPQVTNSTVIVNWNSGAAVQAAPTVNGPWTTITNGVITASTVTTALAQARFFRTVENGQPGPVQPVLPEGFGIMPSIESATVQLLAQPVFEGNSRLAFRFIPGAVPLTFSNSIPIIADNRLIFLNDRGAFPDVAANDGVFSMVVDVNIAEMQAANTRLSQQPPANQFTEQFVDRRLVGTNTITAFSITNFEQGASIPLFATNAFGKLDISCPAGSPLTYDWRKTLMITHLSVVEDPARTWDPCDPSNGTKMGVWTFGSLMNNICNQIPTQINPGDFAREFMRSWEFDQTINSDVVPKRPDVKTQLVNDWLAKSLANGFPAGRLDLSIAPFRLCAIVNRVDLRSNTGFTYGGGSTVVNPCEQVCHGGEARFVFCAVDVANGCSTLPFLIIFEYCAPGNTCAESKAWGAQWAALNSIPFGPAYNTALANITAQFTATDTFPSRPPNKSSVNQVRSNEIDSLPWELREWRLSCCGSDAGFLRQTTVVNTPDADLNNTAVLPGVPVTKINPPPAPFNPYLGGTAPEPIVWDSLPGLNTLPMHNFALNTCNGCHTTETGTVFTHVNTRGIGSAALLSGFLTGITGVVDPRGAAVGPYSFADLNRRVIDLDKLVNCPCTPSFLLFEPMAISLAPNLQVRMAH